MTELQVCQLNILKEIDRICKENQIKYCLAFGSCLGAVRHKGFIPWDDDVDVFMPIDDFERFNQCFDKVKKPYFIQTKFTDKEYGLLITRVRDSNTTLIERTEVKRDINHGVFVDVYPLFNSPLKKWKGNIQSFYSYLYRLFLYDAPPTNHGKGVKTAANVALILTPQRIKDNVRKMTYKKMTSSRYTGICTELYARPFARYRFDWFFPAREAQFEDITIPIPGQAEKFLTKHYGNYMQLPPESERGVHLYRRSGNVMSHQFEFMDLNNSYKTYRGKYYCSGK